LGVNRHPLLQLNRRLNGSFDPRLTRKNTNEKNGLCYVTRF
jgi:hypothetical protein